MAPPPEDISNLVSRTANLHCFDDVLELVPDVDTSAAMASLSLVGKLISSRIVNKHVVRGIFSKAWNISNGFSFTILDSNTFLFGFSKELVHDRMLNFGPWSVMGAHLVLKNCSSQGFLLKRSPHPDVRVQFKYERLSDFCYQCGRISHCARACPSDLPAVDLDSSLPCSTGKAFGPWLRAESCVPAPVRVLWAIVRNFHPNVIFLAETKVKTDRFSCVLSSLGFPNLSSVPPINNAGGLCLCWHNRIEVEVTTANGFVINALVFSSSPSSPWMFIAVYGLSYWHAKATFLNNLEVIAKSFAGPWLCFDDFNCILSQSDKQGGRPFACPSSGGLRDFVDSAALVDLGFASNPFTWSNKQSNMANIKERLDRGFANMEWRIKEAIAILQGSMSSDSNISTESNLQLELYECLKREELLWKQNSRVKWLKDGDRNTKIFHLSSVIRGRKNSIDFLKDELGHWISNRRAIGECFNRQLQTLFASSSPIVPDGLENLIPGCISSEDNLALRAIPDELEIKEASLSKAEAFLSCLDTYGSWSG
ncbi:hypothetical protein L1049_006335 [Liquidambar formosana]|uniref:CCHC-type domain-containing protein n=1 Tax=Liquidambar formosana TaxID=63359 RepID=A0AAP0RF92_LIQFO